MRGIFLAPSESWCCHFGIGLAVHVTQHAHYAATFIFELHYQVFSTRAIQQYIPLGSVLEPRREMVRFEQDQKPKPNFTSNILLSV